MVFKICKLYALYLFLISACFLVQVRSTEVNDDDSSARLFLLKAILSFIDFTISLSPEHLFMQLLDQTQSHYIQILSFEHPAIYGIDSGVVVIETKRNETEFFLIELGIERLLISVPMRWYKFGIDSFELCRCLLGVCVVDFECLRVDKHLYFIQFLQISMTSYFGNSSNGILYQNLWPYSHTSLNFCKLLLEYRINRKILLGWRVPVEV